MSRKAKEKTMPKVRPYIAEPTARLFHASNADVKGIMGPIGSGKTVACCMEVFHKIVSMPAGADGVRRSKWAFIRNTYPELLSTTMQTWKDWIPDEICHIYMGSLIKGVMDFELDDGTRVNATIIFLAIDSDQDLGKLKSLELTGVYLNEASELSLAIKTTAHSRTGRYPAVIDDLEDTFWTGTIMDTNPPPDDHWWYRLAEIDRPENHEFFRQPPAILPMKRGEGADEETYWVANQGQVEGIPAAENVKWQPLGYNYWLRQVHGVDPEWCRVYLMGEYGRVITGKPVHPEYNDSMHCTMKGLTPMRGLPLILGFDFGLTPACAFMQVDPQGFLFVLDECVSDGMNLRTFLETTVLPKLRTEYGGMRYFGVGDPAGMQHGQANGDTCIQILNESGIPSIPSPDASNRFLARRDAVTVYLTRLLGGRPALLIDGKKCPVLRQGLLGAYMFKKMRTGGMKGMDMYSASPVKNFYSHICEAFQYGCLYIKEFGSGTPVDQLGGGKSRRKKLKVRHRS